MFKLTYSNLFARIWYELSNHLSKSLTCSESLLYKKILVRLLLFECFSKEILFSGQMSLSKPEASQNFFLKGNSEIVTKRLLIPKFLIILFQSFHKFRSSRWRSFLKKVDLANFQTGKHLHWSSTSPNFTKNGFHHRCFPQNKFS